MSGYTKLSSSIVHSTIWSEPNHVRIVWITMLAMTNRWGEVEASIPGLAAMARVSIEETEDAINRFLSPDKYSRTKDNDGRRIVEIDGGWEILNYQKYRELQSKEHEAEMATERQRRCRQRKSVTEDVTPCHAPSRSVTPCHAPSRSVTPCHAPSRSVTVGHPIAEAEADAETKADLSGDGCRRSSCDSEDLASPDLLDSPLSSGYPSNSEGSISISKPKRNKKEPSETSGPVWDAYAVAYHRVHGAPPARNARQNALCCQLMKLLGSDAEQVAGYYPSVRTSPYAGSGHSLALLVRDAEKIRTEWLTGRQTTMYESREQDRLKAVGDGWAEIIEKHRKIEEGKAKK
jgi:hypothetical protein